MANSAPPTMSAHQPATVVYPTGLGVDPAGAVHMYSNWHDPDADERWLFDLPLEPAESLFTRMAAGFDNAIPGWRDAALHIPWAYHVVAQEAEEKADGKASEH